MRSAVLSILAAILALAASPASAQLLGGGVPVLGGAPLRDTVGQLDAPAASTLREALDPAEGLLSAARGLPVEAISDLRRRTVERLLRRHADVVEADEAGQPVVRGEVLALAPAPSALASAQAAGFQVARRSDLAGLGLEAVVLKPPRGMSARDAVRKLRGMDPGGTYDFNHLFQTSGGVGKAAAARNAGAPRAPGARLGLVDGSAAARHPALRGARITQRAFAPGGARVTDHATAVASLMVGTAARFHGAAPGADLLVADVYGPTPVGGSAEAIARGLSWLAQNQAAVVNISLVGPANRLLEAAVSAMIARGGIVVAAVGNDGPAAPPLYPATYPGVVAVTAVDARRNALLEAGRGDHVDLAAPGADMAAAGAAGGYLAVRGTSFAAPLVAGAIARQAAALGPRQALEAVRRSAVDLGRPGRDPVYGRGLVVFETRVEPAEVGARALALRGP